MRAQSRWRGGRTVALLFLATVVLPASVLSVLAWRALDADRKLAEQVWRDRLQDSARRTQAYLEHKAMEVRTHAESLARGNKDTGGFITAILTPQLRVIPAAVFAWAPDGTVAPGRELPADLEQVQRREQRSGKAPETAAVYERVLKHAPSQWHGWIHLRLARILAQSGESARAVAALQKAAQLPDSPGPVPTRFAARFELASASAEEAARLYRDLNAGAWLFERSPYAFYEARLRELAGGQLSPALLDSEIHRQAMSRLLDRVVNGESGWLAESPLSAFVATASHRRAAAVLTPESQWHEWLTEGAKDLPHAIVVRSGSAPPRNARFASAISLATAGLPWWIWAEPRDPNAPDRDNQGRRRLLTAILFLVAGVLIFGSLISARLVRRELKFARLQSDFTATVSHEFRSPLTGIRQLAEMLLAGRAANDEARRRHYYELICRESDRLTRLVENVLDLSHIEDGRKQYRFARIDTAEWLRGLAGMAEQRRNIDANLPDALPPVEGDREALSSAVLNLLDNAIKYSPDGTPVALRASGDDGWVTIEVQDYGCGILPEEQRRIFDQFYRGSTAMSGNAKGVGLGLALVKRIADAHGARVRVQSIPGAGSTFFLSLKAAT